MNQFKKTLQRMALTVNRLPFGLYVTKIPYYLAVLVFKWRLSRYPPILAAYARNSFAYGTWIPGRSDIDLTVILRGGLSPRTEFACMRQFRENYAALQRWFPMLGEVEMINESHVDAWTRFAIAGYESRFWLHIYGNPMVRSGYKGDAEQRQRDRLNQAINIYRTLMVPALGSADQQILVRYVKKILRYLDEPNDGDVGAELDEMTPGKLHATVVQRLQQAAVMQDTLAADGNALNLDSVLGRTVVPSIGRASAAAIPRKDAVTGRLATVLRSPYHPKMAYYIPSEGLDDDQLEQCISTIDADVGTSIVMPRALLIRYLECVDPLEYLALLQDRTVLWGRDPLQPPKRLLSADFKQAVCASATHILLAPYNSSLALMSRRDFNDVLFGWLLRTARFFEDSVMEFDYDRLHKYWCRVHPEDNVDFSASNSDENLQRFILLRNIADNISAGLLASRRFEPE